MPAGASKLMERLDLNLWRRLCILKTENQKQDKAIMLWKKMKFTEGEHAKQGERAAGEDKVSKSTYS